jgi:hypothetical protein
MKPLSDHGFRPGGAGSEDARVMGRMFVVLLLLLLPLLLGASWQDATGNTINPRFVERIRDGQTTKHEILLWFGDPKEIDRSSEAPVYKYLSYKDAPFMPYKPDARKIEENSDSLYVMDEKNKLKKPEVKKEGKILRSTLTIRFKPDGETVMSHEYKEF